MVNRIALLLALLFTVPITECKAQCFGNCNAPAGGSPIKFIFQRRVNSTFGAGTSYYNISANQVVTGIRAASAIMGDTFTKVRLMIQMDGTQPAGVTTTFTLLKNLATTTVTCTVSPNSVNTFCDSGEVSLTYGPNDTFGLQVDSNGTSTTLQNLTFVAIP